jgi:hypothetical protein
VKLERPKIQRSPVEDVVVPEAM